MRTFKEVDDLAQVNGWMEGHGLNAFKPGELPKIGVIVDNIACGFISWTDSGVGFLEGYIGNPYANRTQIYKAMLRITRWALSLAKSVGTKRVIVLTRKRSLQRIAHEFGFLQGPQVVLAKDI